MRCLFLFPVLVACTGESVIDKQENSAPTILISSHGDEAEIQEGYAELLRATVSDDDNNFVELQVAWYVGEDLVCDWATASAAGESTCEIIFSPGDRNVISEVRDPQGSGGRAEIAVSVIATQAPEAEILSPLAEGSYYADQLIQFSALVSDQEDPASDLIIGWTSSLDGDLALDTEADSSGEIADAASLSEGEHYIELRVEDSTAKVTIESVVIEVGGDNNEPLCEITEPQSGSAYIVGQNISFTGSAIDDDINNSLLSISWESDQDGEFNATAANTAGEMTVIYNGLSVGNHIVTLRVEDEVGGLCSDTANVAIGTPPTLSVSFPSSGDVISVGDQVPFAATVSDQEDIPSDIGLSWVSDIDGEFSVQGSDSSGNISFSSSTLSAGLHNIYATATDSSGLTASTSLSLRINTPPPPATVVLSPDPLYSTDSISVTTFSAYDDDGDPISYSYQWYENSVLMTVTGLSVAAAQLDVGELWTVRVTPNDGYVDGAYTEETITVSNSDPILSSVSISPGGNAFNDSVLSCSATATDADESVAPTFEWSVGTALYTGASLDLSTTAAMPTAVITCTVSVSDSNGGNDSASVSVTLDNRPPAVSAVAISPSTGVISNSTLSCAATVSDPDGESLSPSYEWTVGTASLGTGAALTLSNPVVQPGSLLTCTATVTDGYGGSDLAADQVTIDNSSPSIDSVTLGPTAPSRIDTLTCAATATDIDGGTPSLSFAFRNQDTGGSYAASSSGTTDATLNLSSTNVLPNEVVECTVTAVDSDGGTAITSATVTVINSAPTFPSAASISPSSGVFTGTALTCSATASDIDDGAITPTYEWTVGALSIAIGSGYTVLASDTDVGDSLSCTATATDSDNETSTSIAAVTVENSVPAVSNVGITSGGGYYNDQVFSCSATVSDPDEVVSASFVWTSGQALGSGSTIDLALTAVLPGGSVQCTASTSDSDGGNASASAAVTIANRAPSTPTLSIIPANPIEALDDLLCSASGSTDPDGETVSYSHSWTSDAGASVSGDTVSASMTAAGEVWTCTVSASDGSTVVSAALDVTIDSNVSWANCPTTQTIGAAQWQLIGESGDDNSGYSTSSAGDVDGDGLDDLLIGAYGNDDGGSNAGKAYLVLAASLGSASTIDLSQADYSFIGEHPDDRTGWEVNRAGDVDGDGLGDILIGAYGNDDGGSNAGKTYLILGSSLGSSSIIDLSQADYSFIGENAGDWSSSSSPAGDVDGDGLGDILIGARYNNDGSTMAGKAYLILGSSLGSSSIIDLSQADYSFVGELTSIFAGWSVANAGDVDGDGNSDILISAIYYDNSRGKVYLILSSSLGSSSSINLSQADYSFIGEGYDDRAGFSMSGGGDVDGDGLDDILIGAINNDEVGQDVGKAYLILASSLGQTTEINLALADYSFLGEGPDDRAGWSVSLEGDVDGDGLADLLIAGYQNDDVGSDAGKSYLIFGSSLTAPGAFNLSQADHFLTGAAAGDYAGFSLSMLGDINGDGLDDIVIGAYGEDDGGASAGMVGLFSACEDAVYELTDGWQLQCTERSGLQCLGPQIFVPSGEYLSSGWWNLNFHGNQDAQNACTLFCDLLGTTVQSCDGPGAGNNFSPSSGPNPNRRIVQLGQSGSLLNFPNGAQIADYDNDPAQNMSVTCYW